MTATSIRRPSPHTFATPVVRPAPRPMASAVNDPRMW
jgi:hypothetical protein